MNLEYHVAKHGSDLQCGSKAQPFLTIGRAAAIAEPGDRIVVHAGVYREWVKPQNGGTNHLTRIVYEAAEGETVAVKGSEQITGWENVEGTTWKVILPNAFFGDYNPYASVLRGDWFIHPTAYAVHAGDVYLNGRSFYEAASLNEVKAPIRRETGFAPPWSKHPEYILDPAGTLYQWYAEVDDENTTIYANFQGADPNREQTEINVRKCCFYPEHPGVNYITVRGFEFAQAACPWTPPTADQPGMVGAHWSKGWIIENNILHDAKCSAISIGKEASTGDNLCTHYQLKPGYQYQMEAVFKALQQGWSKETIGSHCIRNNTIYDCGQNGIVGHMGCVFSTIEHNHIYNIAVKHEFFGYEIAGIKLHAAVDVQILNNHIHHCTMGTWLDWQAQGTRVSKNVMHDNNRDFFIEVTHGPCLVDNNVLASAYTIDNAAQGTAFVHNLIGGSMRRITVPDRSTPYHYAHTTQVASTAVVYGGDDRYFGNLFAGQGEALEVDSCVGTTSYNGFPADLETYRQQVIALGVGDHEKFKHVSQAVYCKDNVYLRGAGAFDGETGATSLPAYCANVQVVQDGARAYLELDVSKEMLSHQAGIVGTATLGTPRITECAYEAPDGSPLTLDTDLLGNPRAGAAKAGPLETLQAGRNRVLIWE
ncbi:MAG TPA: right-handed parallel beta-helix repeat-containing protein [Candidatus Limiplasma sp.]|nr:right-handed parallel beta-helix repeat-containing protein [Candidatus Limiplasma sp.]